MNNLVLLYVLLLFMTFIGSIASLFLKRASSKENLLQMLKDLNIYVGAGLYLLSAILNILLLKHLEYSVVLPLTSVTYLWTMLISYLFLKEKITRKKLLGILFILGGAVLIVL